ncbi:MAG TPA: hypothetical protein VLQ20_08840 [Planococcus sp. (in: firmicutes)]|nr:hypothetical protein [Planococcus sp. (in: firmicutes)]
MIEAYRKLWPSRSGTSSIQSIKELEQKIQIELNDELTHPRVRKSRQEKLDLALQRIADSDLAIEEKADLAQLYKKIAAHN